MALCLVSHFKPCQASRQIQTDDCAIQSANEPPSRCAAASLGHRGPTRPKCARLAAHHTGFSANFDKLARTMNQQPSAMTPQDGYHFSDQIGHLLRRVYQRHTALFQQYIPDSQLTAAQFVVLCSVRDNSGSSLADIVKATVIDQATIRGVVDRLKQRELVQVDHDRIDRRKVVINLTEAGQDLVRDMEPFAKQITESTYGRLNPAERLALDFLLRKMLEGGDSD
jgi:DNA-binding MarR family transcriptional regulator